MDMEPAWVAAGIILMPSRKLRALVIILACMLPMAADAQSSTGKPCRIGGYPHEIICGEISMPVNAGKPALGSMNIAWRKIEARARYPLSDPLVWIPDGLGVDATDRAPVIINALMRLHNTRDLIWLDIRGSGTSSPLQCAPPGFSGIREKIDRLSDSNVLVSCQQEINSRGGLETFGFEAIAADYEAMRKVLGLKQVNVLAEGVGAAVALAWSRINPGAIRKQIFDSPPPLGVELAHERAARHRDSLMASFDACIKDFVCRAINPSPLTTFHQIKHRLPETITVHHPQTGRAEKLTMNDALFAQMLSGVLRSPVRAAALPSVLSAAAGGNWQPFIGLSSLGWAKPDSRFSTGLWLASQCQEFALSPVNHADSIASWFFAMHQQRLSLICPARLPARIRHAASVPTLVFSGGVDPLGSTTFPSVPTAVLIKAPGAGHGVLTHGCAKDVAYRFFNSRHDSPLAPQLDASCLENIPYPASGAVNSRGN